MRKIWEFIKDNLFALGAALGAITATVFAFGLNGSSKIAEAAFKNKKESDKARGKYFKDRIKRVQEFQEIYANIQEEAKKKEQELTKKQKEVLERRRKEYFEADTPEKRKKVVDDIQKNFGKLNYIPLSDIADVESDND